MPKSTESGKFNVTNVGRAPLVVTSNEGKPLNILPGHNAVMFLSESDEKFLRRNPEVASITPADDGDSVTVQSSFTSTSTQQSTPPTDSDEAEEHVTPTELLEKIESKEMDYREYMPIAKRIIGDDWPSAAGGSPKANMIKKLLKQKIAEVSA
jgi:hypothetical protein